MRTFYIAVAAVGVAVGGVAAYLAANRSPAQSSGEFVSGPQVGSKVPGPFEPLHVNGPDAGDEACVFCKYGNDPVVMVFATKPTAGLAALIRDLEKAAAEGAKGGAVGACVVVTDTSPDTRKELGKLADKENLKQVILATIEPQKLKKYAINPDAEATVLLYSKQVVRANHAFKPGELTEKGAAEIGEEAAKHYAGK